MLTNEQMALHLAVAKGGATLDKHLEEMDMPQGYQVAYSKYEVRLHRSNLSAAALLLQGYKNTLKQYVDLYVGIWVDGDYVYLDISKWVLNLDDAMKMAKENNQLAIYDWGNKTCITVK